MALSLATSPILRQLQRLHPCSLSARWLQDKTRLSHPVKFLHKSSIRPNMQSRIASFFKASPKRSVMMKLKDKVPKDFTLIYKAPMENYMKYGYPVTILVFIIAPSLMMYHYYANNKIFMVRREVSEIVFLDAEKEIWFFACALSLCTLAILAVLFKYPVRLYKRNDQQEYIAVFLSAIPLQTRRFNFAYAAQTKFRNPLYFFVPDCQYIFEGKKKAILMAHYFRTPADLCEMVGMD